MSDTILSIIRHASNAVDDDRTPDEVFKSLVEEVGELATELAIESGHSVKPKGKDGILGESIDVILCAIDLIYKKQPDITEEEILDIIYNKCQKWIDSKLTTSISVRTARTISYVNLSTKIDNYLRIIFDKILTAARHGEFAISDCFENLDIDGATCTQIVQTLTDLGYTVSEYNNIYYITWRKSNEQ